MKLSKEDLKKKIDEVITDEDVKIGLLEDIEDSVDVIAEDTEEKVLKTEYDDVVMQLEELKKKYKERFLKTEDIIEELKEEIKEDEDVEEEAEVIDIEEI